MRVLVDPELCEGNARCVGAAPEVFEIGEDGRSRVIMEQPDEALRAAVRMAARLCPRTAVTIVEKGGA